MSIHGDTGGVLVLGIIAIAIFPLVFLWDWVEEIRYERRRKKRLAIAEPVVNAIEDWTRWKRHRRSEDVTDWWTRYSELCQATEEPAVSEQREPVKPTTTPKVEGIRFARSGTGRVVFQNAAGDVLEYTGAGWKKRR